MCSEKMTAILSALNAETPHPYWALGHSVKPNRARPQGFTLLEIMIVIVIIGVSLALAIPSLRSDESETLRQESARVMALLESARDDAVFGGRAVAVRLRAGQLETLRRDPHAVNPTWQPVSTTSSTPRPLAANILGELQIGGARAEDKPDQQTTPVVFLPAGIAAPFELTLSLATHRRTIRGDALGNISVKAFDAASR